jgi:hypothetical protein
MLFTAGTSDVIVALDSQRSPLPNDQPMVMAVEVPVSSVVELEKIAALRKDTITELENKNAQLQAQIRNMEINVCGLDWKNRQSIMPSP